MNVVILRHNGTHPPSTRPPTFLGQNCAAPTTDAMSAVSMRGDVGRREVFLWDRAGRGGGRVVMVEWRVWRRDPSDTLLERYRHDGRHNGGVEMMAAATAASRRRPPRRRGQHSEARGGGWTISEAAPVWS